VPSDKIILSRPSRQKAEDESCAREHEGGRDVPVVC
jgi:hypothetical protein